MKHFIGLNFNGELIKTETKIKFLGLTIDNKLTWDEHTKQIKTKLNSICFAILYKMRKIVPKNKLWLLYHAYFLSIIYYLNSI